MLITGLKFNYLISYVLFFLLEKFLLLANILIAFFHLRWLRLLLIS